MNKQQGFTLIELMIVVAIIAILAAIAIPQYQDYITKSQFSESQTIADGMKTPVAEYYNQTGTCPSNGQGGILANPASYAGKYIAAAGAGAIGTDCVIAVQFKAAGSVSTPLGSKMVYFTGTNNGGTFSWVCDKGNASGIADKYKPQVCNGN